MRGDFSRLTFDPVKHYRGVLLQQGRVQLDADWNEQAEIEAHVDETVTRDLVGPVGGPHHDAAFAVRCGEEPPPPAGCPGDDLLLSPGRYYVNGILCEVEEPVPLFAQPDLPGIGEPTEAGVYLAYLDVWREHVTVLEDPDLREVALGGPDTATRTRTVWQVRLLRDPGEPCSTFELGWVPPGAARTGRLRAQAAPAAPMTDPCVIPPAAGFRRLENQLYRVEIHDGSDGVVTFKWSRDNGSVVAGLVDVAGRLITISEPGRDALRGFAPDQWIELSDHDRSLRGEPGVLVQLAAVRGTELTVKEWPGGSTLTMADFGRAPVVRRWDSSGAVRLRRGPWLDLEDGMQIMFENDPVREYRTGDYWLIPARTANISGNGDGLGGNVEWPASGGDPEFRPPHGVEHRYAPVALLRRSGKKWTLESDCRRIFPPLTELSRFFYVGGEGQEARPGFPVAQPLQVGVSNGRWPAAAARVRFESAAGSRLATEPGGLDAGGASLEAATDADGIAAVSWRPNPAGPHSQQVRATLRDDRDQPIGLPIVFTANLSIASEVAFVPPKACATLKGAETVQTALELVSGAAMLAVVAGDGQLAMPGAELPEPVVVEVVSDCGPVRKAEVVFEADEGGTVRGVAGGSDGQRLAMRTGADGRAAVVWRPAGDADRPVRVLTARLTEASSPTRPPTELRFIANVSVDRNVAYTGTCPELHDARTVQEAIDVLCKTKPERVEAVRVRDVLLLDDDGMPLGNDMEVNLSALSRGIELNFDRPIDHDTASSFNHPAWTVTVELPYPLTGTEQEAWGVQGVVGYEPFILAGSLDPLGRDQERIRWFPTDVSWIDHILSLMTDQPNPIPLRILARIRLEGNFIWAQDDPDVFLDGESFGMRENGRTVLRRNPAGLLTGDGRPGGDFRMWFWIVQG